MASGVFNIPPSPASGRDGETYPASRRESGNDMKKLMAQFLDKTFLRFLLVGAVNTLVGTGVMYGLYNLAHCGYWFSSAMNYVVGSVVSYFLNKRFTFRDSSRSPKTVLRFVLNIAVCYAAAYGAARPLARLVFSGMDESLRENIAMFFGMCIFVALNYLGQRLFAFRNTEEAERRKESQHDQN